MRCIQCEGRKKIHGMGGMKIDCPSCDGTGIIDNDYKESKNSSDLFPDSKNQKKDKKRD